MIFSFAVLSLERSGGQSSASESAAGRFRFYSGGFLSESGKTYGASQGEVCRYRLRTGKAGRFAFYQR